MSITWQEFHGGYNNTGNFNNVVLCGSPSSSGFGGVPLNTAHASGLVRVLVLRVIILI